MQSFGYTSLDLGTSAQVDKSSFTEKSSNLLQTECEKENKEIKMSITLQQDDPPCGCDCVEA